MKIFIENYSTYDFPIQKLNLGFLKKKQKLLKIYSDKGIFEINNNIRKLIPIDKKIEKLIINKKNFLVDNSYFEYKDDIYCIPYNHITEIVEVNEYILNKKSLLSLIVEKSTINFQNFINIYFYTSEKNIDENLKNSIIEYFSFLNNNKQS